MPKLEVYRDDNFYLVMRDDFYHVHGMLDGKRVRKSTGSRDLAKAKLFLEGFKRQSEESWRDIFANDDRDWQAVAAMMCARHRASAAKRGMPFELKPKDIFAMMKMVGFRCSVSGMSLSKKFAGDGRRDPWAPSIDRIENRQGYTLENCRIVCLAANLAMSDWGLDVLLRLSRGIHRSSLTTAEELTHHVPTVTEDLSNNLIRLVKSD